MTTTKLTAAEQRALDFIKSGLDWSDYCMAHKIGNFGETAEACRVWPVRDRRTYANLIAKGVVKVVSGVVVAV